MTLRDHERLTTAELDAIGEALTEIGKVNDRALADETLLIDVDQDLVAQVKSIESDFAQLTPFTQDLWALRELVNQAASNTPSDLTLAKAAEAWQRNDAAAYLAKLAPPPAPIALRMKPAQESLQAMLNAATTEKEKAIVSEAELILDTLETRYRLDIEFQAALPEIKSLLAPMIGHGSMQLGGDDHYSWYPGKPGPLSLSKLKKFGALTPGNEAWLGKVFCADPHNMHRYDVFNVHINDRQLGSFPKHAADDQGEFKRAQELLIKFGDLMVEQGLLSP